MKRTVKRIGVYGDTARQWTAVLGAVGPNGPYSKVETSGAFSIESGPFRYSPSAPSNSEFGRAIYVANAVGLLEAVAYSYSAVIGIKVCGVWLSTTRKWSATTSRHQSVLRKAPCHVICPEASLVQTVMNLAGQPRIGKWASNEDVQPSDVAKLVNAAANLSNEEVETAAALYFDFNRDIDAAIEAATALEVAS